MAQGDFERFRERVLQDMRLQEQLWDVEDRNAFVQLLLSLGREHGYSFGAEEVTAALQASRRAWIERGLG